MVKSNRFKELKNGYRFDKYLFRAGLIIVLLFALVVALYAYTVGAFYVSCPLDTPAGKCYNPYYGQEEFFNNKLYIEYISLSYQEELFAGVSYGQPVPFFVSDAHLLIVIFIVGLFFFNHFYYNKGVLK